MYVILSFGIKMDNIKQNRESAPIRVLVVDDEPGIRKIFCAILEQQNHYTQSANNGREAIIALMKHAFDILVVDLNMGKMNGITFLQEALKIWPWLGVIIVSGYITEDTVKDANKLGITCIMNKPVQLKDLCESVINEYKLMQTRQKDFPAGNALSFMHNHLTILTRLSQNIAGTESLPDILLEFTNSITQMFPADIIGMLLIDKENRLIISPQTEVSQILINNIKCEMIERYTSISGNILHQDRITLNIEKEKIKEDGVLETKSTISVPAIIGNKVYGILTISSVQEDAYNPSDISLLYHAANHISAAFVALEKMHQLITRDPLTGAFNRIRLNEELERAWLASHRYNYSMAVIIVDIDNFKPLNDTFGHNVGDELLCAFAKIMQDVTRTTDIISRYGGDEFVAILPQANEDAAVAFGERLMKNTRSYTLEKDGNKIGLSISIGISTSLNHTKPASCSELLIQADQALYTAKNSGRNRICIWPEHTCSSIIDEPQPEIKSDTLQDTAEEQESDKNTPNRIMLIDDEEPILKVIKAMLNFDGYEVDTFTNATDALKHLETKPEYYNILMTDLGLPDMSGLEVLQRVNDIDDSIIKIVISGQATADNAINALRKGAHDFIQKPVIREQLSVMIQRSLEFYELKRENIRHQIHLEETVNKRSAQLASTLEETKRSYDFTLEAMVAMLDAREHHTARHSIRTRSLAIILSKHLNMPKEDIKNIATGALLHDIGKIGIPDSVLLKEGTLTKEEWTIMKDHPQIGYDILKTSPYLKDAAQIVYQHQEQYDGNGYPQKLKGEEICIGARIFAVIDAYDAMRSKRIYRDPISKEEAVADIIKNSGSQFDPKIVDAFTECQAEIEELFTET